MCSDLMSSHLKKLYKMWGTQNLAFKHETAPIDILHVPDFDTQCSNEIQEHPTPITFISIPTSPTAPNPLSIRILPLPPHHLPVIYSFLFSLSPPSQIYPFGKRANKVFIQFSFPTAFARSFPHFTCQRLFSNIPMTLVRIRVCLRRPIPPIHSQGFKRSIGASQTTQVSSRKWLKQTV
jgi:hypothetical protein